MDNWKLVPLPGAVVSSSHPQTCLNPDKYFEVVDVQFDHGKFFARGENTCLFNIDMLTPKEGTPK
jgi:hypothetical protein